MESPLELQLQRGLENADFSFSLNNIESHIKRMLKWMSRKPVHNMQHIDPFPKISKVESKIKEIINNPTMQWQLLFNILVQFQVCTGLCCHQLCWASSACPSGSSCYSFPPCTVFHKANLYGLYLQCYLSFGSHEVQPVEESGQRSARWRRMMWGHIFLGFLPVGSPCAGVCLLLLFLHFLFPDSANFSLLHPSRPLCTISCSFLISWPHFCKQPLC